MEMNLNILFNPAILISRVSFQFIFLFLSLRIYDTGERHLVVPLSWAKTNSVNSQWLKFQCVAFTVKRLSALKDSMLCVQWHRVMYSFCIRCISLFFFVPHWIESSPQKVSSFKSTHPDYFILLRVMIWKVMQWRMRCK